MITELFIVVALIALNGVLAMSELAVLSARRRGSRRWRA
jgi:CBS domain containing-hemolysin-like protein